MMDGAAITSALQGIRVIEIAGSVGYGGKVLNDLGAEVILIEPPEGARGRFEPPFLGEQPGSDRSLRFHYLNGGKQSVALDLDRVEDCERFMWLARQSDLILDDGFQETWHHRGLGYDRLVNDNPNLTWCAVTPFGQSGPKAQHRACDLVSMAAGGMAWLTGYEDGGPLVPPGDLSTYNAALYGAVTALIALLGREVVGGGQFIDVSVQEVVALGTETGPQFWEMKHFLRRRLGEDQRQAGIGIYPCRDGHVMVYAADSGVGLGWKRLVDWIREAGTPGAERLEDPAWGVNEFRARPESKKFFFETFTAFARTRGKQELFEDGQRRHIAIAPINLADEVLRDPHLNERNYFTEMEVSGCTVQAPGAPYWFSMTPPRECRPAPPLGRDNNAVFAAFMAEAVS